MNRAGASARHAGRPPPGRRPEASGIVPGSTEEFAQELAVAWPAASCALLGWERDRAHCRRWRFAAKRLAIHRIAPLGDPQDRRLRRHAQPIHPTAGLDGAVYLMFFRCCLSCYDAMLAVDNGGRATSALGRSCFTMGGCRSVRAREVWPASTPRDRRPNADAPVARLVDMLNSLPRRRRLEDQAAPFIGAGCPDWIRSDGAIDRGACHLSRRGLEAPDFNLAAPMPSHPCTQPTTMPWCRAQRSSVHAGCHPLGRPHHRHGVWKPASAIGPGSRPYPGTKTESFDGPKLRLIYGQASFQQDQSSTTCFSIR